jgi:hypothetical protein
MNLGVSSKTFFPGLLGIGLAGFSIFLVLQGGRANLLDETGFEALGRIPKLWIAGFLLLVMFGGGMYLVLLALKDFKKGVEMHMGRRTSSNYRPGVDAGWRVLFAFQRARSRASRAGRWAATATEQIR